MVSIQMMAFRLAPGHQPIGHYEVYLVIRTQTQYSLMKLAWLLQAHLQRE
jgi:hypothetical protein